MRAWWKNLSSAVHSFYLSYDIFDLLIFMNAIVFLFKIAPEYEGHGLKKGAR